MQIWQTMTKLFFSSVWLIGITSILQGLFFGYECFFFYIAHFEKHTVIKYFIISLTIKFARGILKSECQSMNTVLFRLLFLQFCFNFNETSQISIVLWETVHLLFLSWSDENYRNYCPFKCWGKWCINRECGG